MIDRQEAIAILQGHINTYHHQITDGGWEQMVRMGIARNTIQDKLAFRADAEKQIQAYKMAIKAEEFANRCYLNGTCSFQSPIC